MVAAGVARRRPGPPSRGRLLPAPLLILACALVGLSLALAAFSQFENGRSPFGVTLWVPVLYQSLVVTPALVYLSLVHPAWTWLYLVDPGRLPIGTTVLAVLAAAAAELAGYLGGWVLLRAHRRRELMLAVAVVAAALVTSTTALRARLGRAGTFAEFSSGTAAALGERKLGWALGIVVAGLLVGLFVSVRFLILQGQREREG